VNLPVVFLDTSFVVALENVDDAHHQRAKELDRQLLNEGTLAILHWGILMEVGDGYARVGRRRKGSDLLDRFLNESRYRVYPLLESLLQSGLQLYFSRPDKDWGLTDCVTFALMQLEGVLDALTADIHFRQAGFRAMLLDE
jgi:uncharacterized protein